MLRGYNLVPPICSQDPIIVIFSLSHHEKCVLPSDSLQQTEFHHFDRHIARHVVALDLRSENILENLFMPTTNQIQELCGNDSLL